VSVGMLHAEAAVPPGLNSALALSPALKRRAISGRPPGRVPGGREFLIPQLRWKAAVDRGPDFGHQAIAASEIRRLDWIVKFDCH